MKENSKLEFKADVTNTFLKTVSAYANYDGGTILFGVDGTGKVIGLSETKQLCLDIENRINDSIDPHPEYSIEITGKGRTITLTVEPGFSKPYFYRSKAYKRMDTATVEVDSFELRRLILEGSNIDFEELPSNDQNLDFAYLEQALKSTLGIDKLSKDVLISLGLYTNESGYNNAANILSDNNSFPGIDIVRFGESISVFRKRLRMEKQSILKCYQNAVEMYRDYYQYEVVDDLARRPVETIPEEAFREAVANAVIHRVWDVNSFIKISMFDDRIEILSIGGLPAGLSEENYLSGSASVLRNPILAGVFHRLKLIESFGTGIARIKKAYSGSVVKPSFKVTPNLIEVTLPIKEEDLGLSKDENIVYKSLSKTVNMPISEIMADDSISFGKSKVTELLKELKRKGIVSVEGRGKATKYRRNR